MAAQQAASPGIERDLDRLGQRAVALRVLRDLSWILPGVLLTAATLRLIEANSSISAPAATLPALAAVLLVASACTAFLSRPRRGALALRLDRKLGTHEVLVTAVEAGPDTRHPLELEVRRRAAEILDSKAPGRAMPLSKRKHWLFSAVAALVLFGASMLPPFISPSAAPAGPEEQERIAEVGETLEEQAEELEQIADELDQESLLEATAALADIGRRMQEEELENREDALLALDEVEKMLESARAEMHQAPGTTAELDTALQELYDNPFSQELASAMQSGDMEQLRKAVTDTANALSEADYRDQRVQQQMQQMAEALEKAAQALREAGKEQEAEALEKIAKALREGDLQKASELFRQSVSVQACNSAGSGGMSREAQRQLSEALNSARFMLGGARPQKLGSGGGGAPNGRPGNFPGTESTSEEGPRFASGGASERDRESAETTNRQELYESLYDAHIIEAESWVDVQVRGEMGLDGEFVSEPGRSAGSGEGAELRSRFVYSATQGTPERAGDLERVPLGYRPAVRRYFAREREARAAESSSETSSESSSQPPSQPRDGEKNEAP